MSAAHEAQGDFSVHRDIVPPGVPQDVEGRPAGACPDCGGLVWHRFGWQWSCAGCVPYGHAEAAIILALPGESHGRRP